MHSEKTAFTNQVQPLIPKDGRVLALEVFSARVYSYFEKGCRKNVQATIPKGNMGYDQ